MFCLGQFCLGDDLKIKPRQDIEIQDIVSTRFILQAHHQEEDHADKSTYMYS